MSVRILLVDDQKIVRAGLGAILKRDPELEIVGEAGNGEEVIAVTRTMKPERWRGTWCP